MIFPTSRNCNSAAIQPLMALVLTLVAVPLSRLRPRQGRYARVGFAIVVYFVYSNLLAASKVWLEKGELPPQIGVWWVHVVRLGLGCTWWCARRGKREHPRSLLVSHRAGLRAMAMAVLLALGALFLFISQQSDIGVGSYSAGDAFLFTF
jgi:lipopolysaccharide export LptBFGC system permease protein LptF